MKQLTCEMYTINISSFTHVSYTHKKITSNLFHLNEKHIHAHTHSNSDSFKPPEKSNNNINMNSH